MELNKYDLVLWVADLIFEHFYDYEFCNCCCLFHNDKKCPECHNKQKLINELLKKYNL